MKFPLFLFAGVAAAVFTAAPLTAQTLTSWDSPVKAAATDGTITKIAGCEGCPDAGAHSATLLTGEGYAEFTPAAGQRLFAGLSADLSEATASSTIDFAFSLWPNGAWEIRERGVYKGDGTFAPGDRFRVSVEGGRVVYRRNGASLYTSDTAPAYPLTLDATLYSLGASLSGATVVLTSTVPVVVVPPPPAPTEPPSGPPVITKTGPYEAATDRATHAKPALPVLGPAGAVVTDPVFGSRIVRVTDASTRADLLDRSYRTPSSPHQNAWSANGTRFYVVGGGGDVLPYSFDATTGTAQRIAAASASGGLVLNFYIEPQFSYVRDSIIYGSVAGGSLLTIDQYDFSTGVYSRLVDLDALLPGLAGTYIGGVASSAGPRERVVTMFGGARQDLHNYALVFDAQAPSTRQLLDTTASTVNGVPTATTLNFLLHHVMIDRSGRYVMLYPTGADMASARKAPQSVLWDTEANVFTEMPVSALPYGHDAFGYGVSVNKDCCTSSSYDAGQWQFRSLATPLVTRDVIRTVLSPKEVYMSDHPTWNNAQPGNAAPYISGTYRHGLNTVPFRAWDDEIIAVQVDPAQGAEATVWRFAHHRSDVTSDVDAAGTSFWYMPRPNVSNDGHWVLFTSNWEKTLGTDPTGDLGGRARQDVFLVALKAATDAAPPVPAPTVVPVTVTTASLAAGRATVAYSASLQASGGSGANTWSVAAGALPGGLTLDGATGGISGTPVAAGSFSFTALVSDTADATNRASAPFTIQIAEAPVALTGSLAGGYVTLPYSGALRASGGSGVYNWTVTAGTLPAGLALGASTGAVGGTPTAAGSFAFTVSVNDAADPTNLANASYVLAIGLAPLRVTTTALPAAREQVAYSATQQTSGGSGGVSWSVTAGALPAGLKLAAATGAISGTPTTAGTYAVTIAATDTADAANVGTVSYTIKVDAAIKIRSPRTLPAGSRGAPYSYAIQVANAQGTLKWELAGGSLPPGITLNATTGVLSGTCTIKGSWSFNARVRDASTNDTLTLSLQIK